MKKAIFLVVLLLCLFLAARSKASTEISTSSSQQTSQSTQKQQSTTSQVAITTQNQKSTTSQVAIATQEPTSNEFYYENILKDVVGEDYLKDKALMRVEDQEVFGNACVVFKCGINSEELFTTLDWFGVSSDGIVYYYDVVTDKWSEFDDTDIVDYEEIDNCIYMLNEYLREEFSAEYCDMPNEIKQAIFKDKNSTNSKPVKLIGINEEIPDGYFYDQIARRYYPVYSFDSMSQLYKHFCDYFTQSYMKEIKLTLQENFLDFEDTLYLVRGGMEYGAVTIDFDSIDYANVEIDNTVFVDKLLFGEKDGTIKITLDKTEGNLKIDTIEYQ